MRYKETVFSLERLNLCCLKSLIDFIWRYREEEAKEGTIHYCNYSSEHNLVLNGSTWRIEEKEKKNQARCAVCKAPIDYEPGLCGECSCEQETCD